MRSDRIIDHNYLHQEQDLVQEDHIMNYRPSQPYTKTRCDTVMSPMHRPNESRYLSNNYVHATKNYSSN